MYSIAMGLTVYCCRLLLFQPAKAAAGGPPTPRDIEELIEAPVAILSTSPERDDTILVHDPFAN